MRSRQFCKRVCTVVSVVILMFMGLTWYFVQKGDWQLEDKGQITLLIDRRIPINGIGEYNMSNNLDSMQKYTGLGFLQMWDELREEFVTSFQKLLSTGANSTDPRLIRLIQSYMFPPSKRVYKLSYNFEPPAQYKITKDYFKKKGMTDGFFVECGGLDGERSSTTYHLEKDGWQGLLIEADPDYFFQSLGKNRRSWKLNAALCPSTEPKVVKFTEHGNSGQGKLTDKGVMHIPCIPLPMILKALGRTRVDFLSLDVEGLEMKILRTLPYKDLDIEAINLEYVHNTEKPGSFNEFMSTVGYTLLKKIDQVIPSKRLYTNDLYYLQTKKMNLKHL